MKRLLPLLLAAVMLAGCGAPAAADPTAAPTAAPTTPETIPTDTDIPFTSRFDSETTITLSDTGIEATGINAAAVFASNDIIYYEDRETYDSGNPYGEGEAHERHSAEVAAAHTVVNITAPGTYRVSGKLSAGQIRIDLGDDAYETPDAVVELILDNANITCTVAPAVLFLNVYECDGNWSEDTAKADVDTTLAGANLILQGINTVSGSHVARIYKDKEGEKKLWKQDGAVYAYMSMNVYGPGSLDVTADNEGLNSELHLTINGGDITIRADNDGINTNEDNVSVTTINGGSVHIIAGLGKEGDGIDSNGYLVINGGTVIAAANPAADAGLDSDLGSYIHGGTVVALGSAMDWAESDSNQVTMNLQFAQHQQGALEITSADGTPVFSFDPAADKVLSENIRSYQGAIVSCPNFQTGDSYHVYAGGVQMMYTGTDVMMGPGGMGGGFGGGMRPGEGEMPEIPNGEIPTMPENWNDRMPGGMGGQQPPEGFDGEMPTMPGGEMPEMPEGEIPTMPEGETMPEDFDRGNRRPGGMNDQVPTGEGNTLFYMQDKVNFFSGLTAVQS